LPRLRDQEHRAADEHRAEDRGAEERQDHVALGRTGSRFACERAGAGLRIAVVAREDEVAAPVIGDLAASLAARGRYLERVSLRERSANVLFRQQAIDAVVDGGSVLREPLRRSGHAAGARLGAAIDDGLQAG
jgi:hypothetical protein